MSEKKVGKRLLTWVLVLVMTLSLLPLNVLAANPAVMRIVRPDTDKYITYNFYLNEVVSRVMRKFDLALAEIYFRGRVHAPWLPSSGQGAKGQGRRYAARLALDAL